MPIELDYGIPFTDHIARLSQSGKRGQRCRKREDFFQIFPNCFYCKGLLTLENRTLDHWIPKSKRRLATVDRCESTECDSNEHT